MLHQKYKSQCRGDWIILKVAQGPVLFEAAQSMLGESTRDNPRFNSGSAGQTGEATAGHLKYQPVLAPSWMLIATV